MLAQIGKGAPPTGPDWLYEIKWDGVRAICYIQNGQRADGVAKRQRDGAAVSGAYPSSPITSRRQTAILDGEIAALDDRGPAQLRAAPKPDQRVRASAIATLSRNLPVVIFVFDLLYLNGRDLRGEPLIERKKSVEESIGTQ